MLTIEERLDALDRRQAAFEAEVKDSFETIDSLLDLMLPPEGDLSRGPDGFGPLAMTDRAEFIPLLRVRAGIGITFDRSLTPKVRADLRRALRSDRWLEVVKSHIAAKARAEGWPDMGGILEWFKAHWLQVLQILLALLPLFLANESTYAHRQPQG